MKRCRNAIGDALPAAKGALACRNLRHRRINSEASHTCGQFIDVITNQWSAPGGLCYNMTMVDQSVPAAKGVLACVSLQHQSTNSNVAPTLIQVIDVCYIWSAPA